MASRGVKSAPVSSLFSSLKRRNRQVYKQIATFSLPIKIAQVILFTITNFEHPFYFGRSPLLDVLTVWQIYRIIVRKTNYRIIV